MPYLDGKLLKPNAPELSLAGNAFKYGESLFETLRVYQGKVAFREDHFRRLFAGMYFLGFKFEEESFEKELLSSLSKLLKEEKWQHGRLRLEVFADENERLHHYLEGVKLPLDYYAVPQYFSLTDFRILPLHFSPLSSFKHGNRMPYLLATRYAQEKGFDDAILFCEGNVSESANANLFLIKDKQVITPPLKSACLNGIMRAQVKKLCHDLKLKFTEKKIEEKDLLTADEVFLTNVIRGILPVWRYNQREWDKNNLPLTQFLRNSLFQTIDALYGNVV